MSYVGYANKVTATCCNGSFVNFFILRYRISTKTQQLAQKLTYICEIELVLLKSILKSLINKRTAEKIGFNFGFQATTT